LGRSEFEQLTALFTQDTFLLGDVSNGDARDSARALGLPFDFGLRCNKSATGSFCSTRIALGGPGEGATQIVFRRQAAQQLASLGARFGAGRRQGVVADVLGDPTVSAPS
jgi:hypothetical protein